MSLTNYKDIKVIGFDLDQTLYPKSPEIDEAIQIYLYKKIAELKQVSLKEASDLFNNLYKEGKGLSGSKTMIKLGFQEENARDLVQEALENADIAKFLIPNQEVNELLQQLKNKYQNVDIITGSNKTNSNLKLKKLGISEKIFSQIISADDASKSDLSAFNLWISCYPNYKPKNFIYIGDRISSDYEKPKELGIASILVNIKNINSNIDCLQLSSLLKINEYL